MLHAADLSLIYLPVLRRQDKQLSGGVGRGAPKKNLSSLLPAGIFSAALTNLHCLPQHHRQFITHLRIDCGEWQTRPAMRQMHVMWPRQVVCEGCHIVVRCSRQCGLLVEP